MNVKLVISQQLGTVVPLDSLEKIHRKLELCQNYMEVYDKVSQGYTKWRGRLLEQLSSAEIKLGIRQFEEVIDFFMILNWYCRQTRELFRNFYLVEVISSKTKCLEG